VGKAATEIRPVTDGEQRAVSDSRHMMAMQTPGLRREVVRLDLDFGSYELGLDECRALTRILRRRGEEPEGALALACADRLEALLDGRVEPHSSGGMTEEQLDTIADAAWEWLRRAGRDGVPERVLVLLDALRARHVHE
jgi:hypothetical protein